MPRGIPDNLVGAKYGAWTVLSRTEHRQCGHVMWNCRCDCGAERTVSTGNLKSGASKGCRSCGARKGRRTLKARTSTRGR